MVSNQHFSRTVWRFLVLPRWHVCTFNNHALEEEEWEQQITRLLTDACYVQNTVFSKIPRQGYLAIQAWIHTGHSTGTWQPYMMRGMRGKCFSITRTCQILPDSCLNSRQLLNLCCIFLSCQLITDLGTATLHEYWKAMEGQESTLLPDLARSPGDFHQVTLYLAGKCHLKPMVCSQNMEVSINGGTPIAGCFIMEKSHL